MTKNRSEISVLVAMLVILALVMLAQVGTWLLKFLSLFKFVFE